MKRKTIALGTLAAAFLSVPAIATADTGLYIGGSVGSTTIKEDFDGTVIDDDATAYRLVTGFQFGDMLGIEIGYQDFGEVEELPVLLSAEGWTAGATLDLPVSDTFSLFGRAGVFFWDADVVVDGFSIDLPSDEDFYYGAGAKVDVSRNLSLVGDWSRFELDNVDTDVISIGFTYTFGN